MVFSFRLYPIVPNNTRVLKEDVVLSGYRVPAGVSYSYRLPKTIHTNRHAKFPVLLYIITLQATITMSTIVSGRLPEYFPEPEKFKPERWSRDNPEPPNAFASLPFGFGRRMCVGESEGAQCATGYIFIHGY